jgi:hypothetical protein
MKQPQSTTRLTAWLAALVLLHGCAAATVIQKQPDFNDENQQRLQRTFQVGKVATAAPADATR